VTLRLLQPLHHQFGDFRCAFGGRGQAVGRADLGGVVELRADLAVVPDPPALEAKPGSIPINQRFDLLDASASGRAQDDIRREKQVIRKLAGAARFVLDPVLELNLDLADELLSVQVGAQRALPELRLHDRVAIPHVIFGVPRPGDPAPDDGIPATIRTVAKCLNPGTQACLAERLEHVLELAGT
jgi:hypothetical protein